MPSIELSEKFNDDNRSLNQINTETVSSGSSINISNIMVSSSSSCGNYMNVVSSSSSSLGNQNVEGNLPGSDLSSSSRRSSISGDLETKILNEDENVITIPKSNRKPKRVNILNKNSRKTRRLIRCKRQQDNVDADIDDDESDVFEESENDLAVEKDEKSRKFNCLDLDLFDYLLKRNNFQNRNDIKILNSSSLSVKQRKLSLITTNSEFENNFQTNLNINKYFFNQLMKKTLFGDEENREKKNHNYNNNNKKNNFNNNNNNDSNCDIIKVEVNNLINDLLIQVENKFTDDDINDNVKLSPKPIEKSLIKTLLEDMSTLNCITSDINKKNLINFNDHEKTSENLCLEKKTSSDEISNETFVLLNPINETKTSLTNPEIPGGIIMSDNDARKDSFEKIEENLPCNYYEMDKLKEDLNKAHEINHQKSDNNDDDDDTIRFKQHEDLNILSTQQEKKSKEEKKNISNSNLLREKKLNFEILDDDENKFLNTKKTSCENEDDNNNNSEQNKNLIKVEENTSDCKMTQENLDDSKTRSLSGESSTSSSSSSVSSNSACLSDSTPINNNNNIKKVVLKNNEIVLIEECIDDEDEEEKKLKLLKSSNLNIENLINDSSTPVVRAERPEPRMSKSQTFNQNIPTKNRSLSNKDDDPYVKAALERFDAFCKSKSSHNLNQTSASPSTPTFVASRQKSPYLTRKSTGSGETDSSIKENVSSFIKRRSTKIDPNLISRSASETRGENSTKPSLATSSLAKKFLGSLTPQLNPVEPDNVIENEETDKNNNLNKNIDKIVDYLPTKPTDLILEKKSSQTTTPSTSPPSSKNNSPPSSPTHKSKSNVIKLEVFNSKNKPPNKIEEKNNKPPIPPTISSSPVQSPSTWRSKLKPVTTTENSNNISKPISEVLNETKLNTPTTNKNTSSVTKPTSRIIPIEIKNSKQQQQSSTSKTSINQRTPAKSVERMSNSNLTTTQIDSIETNKSDMFQVQSSTPSVQDRIRSLSTSYREKKDLNDRNMPLSFSKLRDDLSNLSNCDDGTENIYESLIKENPIRDTSHDPIVEKACSNFMTRLMEFQRLHASYQPYQIESPMITSYSGPIVTARNTNPDVPFDLTNKPTYSSTYVPSHTSTYNSPSLVESFSKPSNSDLESTSTTTPRPYVSAIRKRRTLFSDGFDSASTEFRGENTLSDFVSSTNSFNSDSDFLTTFSTPRPTTVTIDESKNTGLGFSLVRNRPLSIVSEEANLNTTNSGLNRSYTMNDTRVKILENKESEFKNRSSLKKSNSICSNKNDKIDNSCKSKSSVFDRLTVNQPVNVSSTSCLLKTNSGSSINNNSRNYEIKKKEENEIAVVTSCVPKTRRESTTSNSTNSSISTNALNRIRSLDSKSRDKFKSTTNLKSTNNKSCSSTNSPVTTNVPACYLYPCQDLKTQERNKTKLIDNEPPRRKSQNTLIKTPPNETNKNDVFERLSKKANSMKNLSQSLTKNKNSSSSSSSSEDVDHKSYADELDDNVFHSNSLNTNQTNNSNKTSVFERLYKSNIAAHMNNQDDKSSSLKKNMSVSSANLISNLASQSSKKLSLKNSKNFINTRVSLKNSNVKKEDSSGNEESINENKTSDSEGVKLESSPRDESIQSKQVSSSFLSKKLMDLFEK
ncbi:unnamed protein product [Brachionus calyciflorus]|uniref:Uncharacterized protein n=1 Tax=Brachionus calyciflorus TaxID=104777 RepID=A0A813R0N9_9BILA|nr:unnamed protein product [Brachionus calyciflorus]